MYNWYESWFDTKFYHILYEKRNKLEANFFIKNLIEKLQIPKNKIFLDVACGKGRHTKEIAGLGYKIEGIDLSLKSIKYAKDFENDLLKFTLFDMRKVFKKNYFDIVLNLFTSFGYFETIDENEKALKSILQNLNNDGMIIIDFMNVKKVVNNLVASEEIIKSNVNFKIYRKHENKKITKDIYFKYKGKNHHYVENVFALTLSDFSKMLNKFGYEIINLWGNYNFKDFNEEKSERLIISAKRF